MVGAVEYDNDIRSYLSILEYYSNDAPVEEPIVEEPVETVDPYKQRLADIIFDLRSHTDLTGGEYSLGFEQGLEMAARMIENLIKGQE